MKRIKRFRTNILNEARVLRTIDPKIWATMSSTSSKNRATKAADNKPKSTDPKEVILQKYVAGLLTMGVDCPLTPDDITKNIAYQRFGIAYLNMGGSLQDIQKLYVENGGALPTNTSIEEPFDEPTNEPELIKQDQEKDYPDYDEIDINDVEEVSQEDTQDSDDWASYNTLLNKRKQAKAYAKEYGYDDPMDKMRFGKPKRELKFNPKRKITKVDSFDDYDFHDNNEFSEKINDIKKLRTYFRTLSSSFYGINAGESLVYDNTKGLIQSDDDTNEIMKCVISIGDCPDKKARFMYDTNQTVSIDFVGNNGKYEDYYFKTSTVQQELKIIPGSQYYKEEENKGLEYTKILNELGNSAANIVRNLEIPELENITIDDELKDLFIDNFKKLLYIPTLPELVKAIDFLTPGNYITSSITDDGEANLVLSIDKGKTLPNGKLLKQDNVLTTDDPTDQVKVVAFIKF